MSEAFSYKDECPHCGTVITKTPVRTNRGLKPPRIPEDYPEWSRRRALLSESQDGWCAICDDLPVKKRSGFRRFTCGRPSCVRAWANLSVLDCNDAKRKYAKAVP